MEKLFENLGARTPCCKNQRANARWVMAYSIKTQFFMKNRGQQKCLDEALILILVGWHLEEHDIILNFVLASVVLAMTLFELKWATH